jgi:hypothetical protein
MKEVSPQIQEIAQRHPQLTVFTRFVPPKRLEDMSGMWRSYYEAYSQDVLGELTQTRPSNGADRLTGGVKRLGRHRYQPLNVLAGYRTEFSCREPPSEMLVHVGGRSR